MSNMRNRVSILDKPLNKSRSDVSISLFGLLFSEIVQYCQNRVYTIPELQTKVLDLLFVREKNYKRETKLLNILLFVKSSVWKTLFGKEADKLEQANDDDKTYYLIEKEPLVTKFISVPKDRGSLNCASFVAGIIEAILIGCNFPAKVTAHWYKGTTFMIKFEESVIVRDKAMENR
ncbi:hypothetical protein MTO96_008750 [Rhipicephalus appendiculatus]